MGPVLVLATAVSTLGGLVFGYELGIISGALLLLQAQFHLNCVQQETVVSALLIGAICSSVIGGWLIDHHGRKASILLSNLLILGGSLVLSVGNSFAMLATGRIVVGFAICLSSMSCCIFVSEMVEPRRRGLMVTLYEAGVTAGILLAYAVNYVFSATQEGWRYMFGLASIPSLAQLFSVWVLPSHHGTVVRLITETQSPSDQSDSVEEGTLNQAQVGKKQYSVLQLFHHKDNMCTRTIIGIGLVLFQQFTGQPNVLFYASTIFQSVGFKSNASAVLASVGLGIVKVIATMVAMICADKVGRRPLLISGCLVMSIGLILIGFLNRHTVFDAARQCSSSELHPNGTILPAKSMDLQKIINSTTDAGYLDTSTAFHAVETFNWLVLISMMSVVSAFSVGFGPMKSSQQRCEDEHLHSPAASTGWPT
ncbi:solute carrier family 2, facilitated glucose transporter member 10 isoform X2 [Brachyhypopomus gauderio]|uniref:solute carrier family 2, facilitated glucose transporter member 10 isoform X2 n=1 Tax=Brachyhypopomus gauderio TaxID=698409 RepID=UPI004041DCEF